MQSADHKRLIEAALFMASEPLDMGMLSKITGISSLGYLKGSLLELRDEFSGRGFHLVEGAKGWSFQVDRMFLDKVAGLTPYSDLPEGHKRTLALIAYKEPITQSELMRIQGSKCYAYVRDLREKGLVKAERHGRTKKLSLTREFERYFGEEKEKIREQLIRKLDQAERTRAEPQEAGPEDA